MTRCGDCGQTDCDKNSCPGWSADADELREALVGGPLMNVMPTFLGVPIVIRDDLPHGVAAVFVNDGEIVGTIMETDLHA